MLTAVLAAGALLGTALPAAPLDWQTAKAWQEPWRWWTASWVHLDRTHLLANLAGAAVLAVFGGSTRCTSRDAAAWAVAWPLTQGLLLLAPDPVRVAGLSGVLHAGVAVAALGLILRESGRARAVGVLVLAGLLLKLLGEQAWVAPERSLPGWDFPVAVLSHATGAGAGLLCATVAWATSRRPVTPTMGR